MFDFQAIIKQMLSIHLLGVTPVLDADRDEKVSPTGNRYFDLETNYSVTPWKEKLNYSLNFRVGCNVCQSIHTLYERLNAEQDVTRGIEFGDTEMEREQGGESPIPGNTKELQSWNFRNIRKEGRTLKVGSLEERGLMGNHLYQKNEMS